MNDGHTRILLIEDRKVAADIAERVLDRFGTVRVAASMDEARKIIAHDFRPTVVITDLNLRDGRDWRETFAEVERMVPGAHHIAALTASNDDQFREEFRQQFSAPLFDKSSLHNLAGWVEDITRQGWHKSDHSKRAIREEFFATLAHHGVPEPVERNLARFIDWVVRWCKRGSAAVELGWKTLLVFAITGIAGWIVLALKAWSEGKF